MKSKDIYTNIYGTEIDLSHLTEEQKKETIRILEKDDKKDEILNTIKETSLKIICTPLSIVFHLLWIISTIAVRIASVGMIYGIYKAYKVYGDVKSGVSFMSSSNLESAVFFILLPFLVGILSYILSRLSDFLDLRSF